MWRKKTFNTLEEACFKLLRLKSNRCFIETYVNNKLLLSYTNIIT